MYLNLIGTFSILCICCLSGFVAFAFFYGCDPFLDNKKISKYDQVLFIFFFHDENISIQRKYNLIFNRALDNSLNYNHFGSLRINLDVSII